MKTLNQIGIACTLVIGGALVLAVKLAGAPDPQAAYWEQFDCNPGSGQPEPQCCPSGFCEDS